MQEKPEKQNARPGVSLFSFFPPCAGRILSRIACFPTAKTVAFPAFLIFRHGISSSGVGLGASHCASVKGRRTSLPLSSVLDHGRPWMERRSTCHNQVFFCFWCPFRAISLTSPFLLSFSLFNAMKSGNTRAPTTKDGEQK